MAKLFLLVIHLSMQRYLLHKSLWIKTLAGRTFVARSDLVPLFCRSKSLDQVLLKVVNPNVDVNVDVDVTYMDFAFY